MIMRQEMTAVFIGTDCDIVAGFISKKNNRIDYSNADKNEIRKAEKILVGSAVNLPVDRIFFIDQEHSDNIIVIDSDASEGINPYCAGTADAMISNQKDICLVIRTADCVPVLLYDGKRKVIGAVHSGWKSSVLDIAGKTVNKMRDLFDSDPCDIEAFILPSISPESYNVGIEVSEKFPQCTHIKENKMYVDLWKSVEISLLHAGVCGDNIIKSNICTYKCEEYFSHRKGDSGRTLNFIVITR